MTEVENIIVKWGGKEYTITGLQSTSTVLQLKNFIYAETRVLPERQKLLGLKCSGECPRVKISGTHWKCIENFRAIYFTLYR